MTLFQDEFNHHKEKLELYFETSSAMGIVLIDPALIILDCNQGFTRMFQLMQKPFGLPVADFLILRDNDLKNTDEIKLSFNRQSGMSGILYCHSIEVESGHLLFCERMILTESRSIEQIGVLNNELINMQRESVKKNLLLEKLRRELDEHITGLEAALSRVRQLEGIITICAYCKKIRDDQDIWNAVEKYIAVHPGAQFSHGLCPSCYEREMGKIEE